LIVEEKLINFGQNAGGNMKAAGKSGLSIGAAALLTVVLSIAGPGCERSTDPVDGLVMKTRVPFSAGDTLTLGFRETAENIPSKTFIRFDSVLEDSRCPIDVVCIWEGNVKLSFMMDEPGGRHPFELNTHTGFTRDTLLAGRRIGLIGVLPGPPEHGRRLDPAEYKAVLTIR
jgi:hypothetical protein